jgi:hypothetical protein
MPFFNEDEFNNVKRFLASVLDDADLKAQFKKASARAKTEPGDHRAAMLGQYARILKQIQDERAKPIDRTGIVQSPDLEALVKKYIKKKP